MRKSLSYYSHCTCTCFHYLLRVFFGFNLLISATSEEFFNFHCRYLVSCQIPNAFLTSLKKSREGMFVTLSAERIISPRIELVRFVPLPCDAWRGGTADETGSFGTLS